MHCISITSDGHETGLNQNYTGCRKGLIQPSVTTALQEETEMQKHINCLAAAMVQASTETLSIQEGYSIVYCYGLVWPITAHN